MYQEVTKDEYQDHYGKYMPLEIETFSENEFFKIKLLLKGYKVERKFYPGNNSECINIFKGKFKDYLHIYNIDKMSDDWYLVADAFRSDRASDWKFYKCDQFDGLLKLLSDTLVDKMKHIKTFEASKPPIGRRRYERPSKETLEKIQSELEDFLLDELDTYELTDEDEDGNGGKSLKELPAYGPSRPRYVFNIKFKTPFTKSAESLSKRLVTWDNDYNFTLKSIECQSSSYWSEEREQTFTNIKIIFDL